MSARHSNLVFLSRSSSPNQLLQCVSLQPQRFIACISFQMSSSDALDNSHPTYSTASNIGSMLTWPGASLQNCVAAPMEETRQETCITVVRKEYLNAVYIPHPGNTSTSPLTSLPTSLAGACRACLPNCLHLSSYSTFAVGGRTLRFVKWPIFCLACGRTIKYMSA